MGVIKVNNLCFLLMVLVSCNAQEENNNKLCTDNINKDACGIIERENTYGCAENIVSKTDCILNIDKGQPQFSVLGPEQALLAANLVSDNVVVIGEITSEHLPYQTTVIVRKFYNNSFENLRGKRFCHPGFKHNELVTKYVLKEFESKIIKLNDTYCDANENVTIVEKQLKVLSNFFGSSCRPGLWVDNDDTLDQNLKNKYSNLCQLCGESKCNVDNKVPFNDAIKCLTQSSGDVALTSLSESSVFFNDTNNLKEFIYLCPDGSTKDPLVGNCTWTNQLKRVIITEKTVASKPKEYLQSHLENHIRDAFKTQSLGTSIDLTASLESLLQLSRSEIISFVDPQPLKTYVSARRSIPDPINNTFCQETVNWCTQNEAEQQKCIWLQQASLNHGLQPVIQCIESSDNDTVSCLNDVQSGKADVAFADITYGYIALRKGLTSVAYPETVNTDLATVVIVVRNNNTDIRSLSDLKGKSACFPQYGGREWLSFIDLLKSKNIMSKSCDYSKLFSDFVGSSCVPGSRDRDYGFDTGDSEKLCDQCIPYLNTVSNKYCNADSINKYFGTDGALRCLENGGGEYAVITLKDIHEHKDKSDAFKVLCRNGSLAQHSGFSIDTSAAITIITSGEIVAKNDTNKREDIVQLLKGIEVEFAETLRKTFKVFEKFNDTLDLIFPDSTPGLTFDGIESGSYIENFKNLLRNSEQCLVNPNTAASFIPPTILMMVSIFIIRFQY